MPEHLWSPQFRDEATGSLYPFGDDATLVDEGGTVTLDRDMFVDASFYPIGGGAGLYLSAIVAAGRATTLWFGTEATPRLCSATFDPLVPPAALVVADVLGRPAGLIVCDATVMAIAQTWADGTYTFAPEATPVVAGCVIPMPSSGVHGILAGGQLFSGDVWLVGDDGVVLSQPETEVIRVDIVGDPLFARRLCLPTGLFETPRFLRTINGVAPDQYGNFQLDVSAEGTPGTILRLSPIGADALLVQAVGRTIAG